MRVSDVAKPGRSVQGCTLLLFRSGRTARKTLPAWNVAAQISEPAQCVSPESFFPLRWDTILASPQIRRGKRGAAIGPEAWGGWAYVVSDGNALPPVFDAGA